MIVPSIRTQRKHWIYSGKSCKMLESYMLDQIIQLISHGLQHEWLFTLLGCVAIYKPKGVQIAKKYLSNSFENNKDGAGFAYAKDGKITINKGYFSFEEFWKAFK